MFVSCLYSIVKFCGVLTPAISQGGRVVAQVEVSFVQAEFACQVVRDMCVLCWHSLHALVTAAIQLVVCLCHAYALRCRVAVMCMCFSESVCV